MDLSIRIVRKRSLRSDPWPPVDLDTPGFVSRDFRDKVLAEAVELYDAASR